MSLSLIVFFTMIVAFTFFLWMAKTALRKTPMVQDHEEIITITEKNFEEVTRDKIILVDFWAEWCAPCRLIAPVLNELTDEMADNHYIGKINIERYPSLAQRFNVRGIPTLLILKNGVEVKRIVGVKTKAYLVKELKQIQ